MALQARSAGAGRLHAESRCPRHAHVARAQPRCGAAAAEELAVASSSGRGAGASAPTGGRRAALAAAVLAAAAPLLGSAPAAAEAGAGAISDIEPMEALKDKDYGKPRMKYGDFARTGSGLQYLDLREGAGDAPRAGQTVVVDWSGYTIGYYGRPFEARNKPKGSSFTGENKDYYRFRLGGGDVIPGFDEAVAGMKVGGIRRIVVPVELGYPGNNWKRIGPKPSTFAGERALDFVLSNRGMIDKTLLFDIELMRVQQ